MRLMSWNVNGLRAILRKADLKALIDTHDPDVVFLQEIKAKPEQVELDVPGYRAVWNSARRPGYSGVLALTRVEPLDASLGIGQEDHDKEGRVVTLEFDDYYAVGVYTPNSGSQLKRLEYRTQEWDPAFRRYVKKLEKKKPVIFGGDLNVAHREIDLARPDDNHRSAGFTDEEREAFDATLRAGFVDTFREFCDEGGHYTWWSYRTRARPRNIGWRIDYFCASESLRPRLRSAGILSEVMGSDHCPVTLEIE